MSTLAAFLMTIAGSIAARVFISLGISIVSYTGVTILLNSIIDQLRSYYGALPSVTLQLANLGGMGYFFAIVTAAFITRASLMILKKFRVT
jgi:hypothetical protein